MLPEDNAFLFGVLKLAKATPNSQGRHTFGGNTPFRGATREDCDGLLVHHLYSLDLADPALPFSPPGLKSLPLFYCFDFRANTIGYRFSTDDSLQFFFDRSDPNLSSEEEWPYEDYPERFPRVPMSITPVPYNPQDPEDVYAWAGIFGMDHISKEGEELLQKKARESARLWQQDAPQTREELSDYLDMPFSQGRPTSRCMNPLCEYSQQDRRNQLRTIAIVPNCPTKETYLFGKYEDDVILIFQMCEKCQTIRVSNQCT